MKRIVTHLTRRLVLVALFAFGLLASAQAAGANTPTCADLTFKNDSAVDIKVKEVINGNEVTRERLSPGEEVVVEVKTANDVWRVRRPSDRAMLWQGPSSCADERIVLGGAGPNDNDAPILAIGQLGIVISPVVISGTFNDASEIVEVKAAVRAIGTQTYYRPDGSTASWHRLDLNGVSANGTADWSTPPLDLPAGNYEIITRASDEHGNRSPWLANSFTVSPPPVGQCTLTFTNSTGAPFVVRNSATELAIVPAGEARAVVVEPGDRINAFQNFRTIWQYENVPAGIIPDNCTSRDIDVDGTCVNLIVINESPESIKVKRNTNAGEQTVDVLSTGETGNFEWSHSTEALVVRRPSNFDRLVNRNLGFCGDVELAITQNFSTPIRFG